MIYKIILFSLMSGFSAMSYASQTLELAGFVSAWRCTNVPSHGCQGLVKKLQPQNFIVFLNQYGVESRGNHVEHYDISGHRFTATFYVSKLDFQDFYKIEVTLSTTKSDGSTEVYDVASTKLLVGKELSPLAVAGRVVITDNVQFEEKLTPVIFLGSPNETFDYTTVSP